MDFSTGSLGIGATAPIRARPPRSGRDRPDPGGAVAALRLRPLSRDPRGRFCSLLGDAETDEGAVWEAIIDPEARSLGELVGTVELNHQSLDRAVPDVQIRRLQGMFDTAGWQVLTDRLVTMPDPEYQRLLRARPRTIWDRNLAESLQPIHGVQSENVLLMT